MPTIVTFDTNYLRGLSGADFLAGRLPERLQRHVRRVFDRGDLVLLTQTVRLEMNAWLDAQRRAELQQIEQAVELLPRYGFQIDRSRVTLPPQVDVWPLFHDFDRRCELLSPSLEDYAEAERLTSYRLPPHPKNLDGEEMRDRVIWVQLVRYAQAGRNRVLMVSSDTIFKNGANEFGADLGIEVVSQDSELEQRLGAVPDFVAVAVRALLLFADRLNADVGVNLQQADVSSLDDLRKVDLPNGTQNCSFTIRTVEPNHVMNATRAVLTLVGENPLGLEWGGRRWDRQLGEPGFDAMVRAAQTGANFTELQRLLRGA